MHISLMPSYFSISSILKISKNLMYCGINLAFGNLGINVFYSSNCEQRIQ